MAPALLEVARHIGPLIGPNTVVLTAMNGVPWWFLHRFGGRYENSRLRAVDATGEIGAAIPAASVSDQIQKDTWYKLWGNMTVNPISDITGATTDLILGDELVRGFASSVMLEAKEIDALVTVVKELAMLTGVPTPFTDVLLGLSRLQARVRGLY